MDVKAIILKVLFTVSGLFLIIALFAGGLSDILQDKKILTKDFKDDRKNFDRLRNIRIISVIISIILLLIYLLLGGSFH
jgi:hypothetical protein